MKKSILVVSFGTSNKDTLKKTIDAIEDKIKNKFEDYEVRRAFTSHKIINKLIEKSNIFIDTMEEALEKLFNDGFEEIIVQPLNLIPDEEFEKIKLVVEDFKKKETFKKILLGRPALYFQGGVEKQPDDYEVFIKAIEEIIPKNKAIVFMGHGTSHIDSDYYVSLENALKDKGKDSVYIATFESYPTLNTVIKNLKKDNVKELVLAPLFLIFRFHDKKDMIGSDEGSWKNILKREGFSVETHLRSLGELDNFQNIYINHVKDTIEEGYNIAK